MSDTPTLYAIPSATSLKRAITAAKHFGFAPVESVVGNVESRTREFPMRLIKSLPRSFSPLSQEVVAALAHFSGLPRAENPGPLLLYHLISENGKAKEGEEMQFGLDIVGNGKSVAEALIMKASLAVLQEFGVKEISIKINSVGDRDSAARFARELQLHLRKNINDLPAPARSILRENCFGSLSILREKGHNVCTTAPRSIDYLSEPSRRHLSEVLEFLESMNVSYELDTTLLSERETATHTLFEILHGAKNEFTPIARGGRYDEVARKLLKTSIPAIGVIFTFKAPARATMPAPQMRGNKKPKIFFIYVGPEAKRKSLVVIDMLRESRIPLEQSLGRDKFSAQLLAAEKLRVPWTIIMGHKEALDGTVIVRHMDTRSQEIIPLLELPVYLKKEVL